MRMADSRRNDQWYRAQHGNSQVTISRLVEENRLLRADLVDKDNEITLLRSMLADHSHPPA